jgi:hypothetical protein
MDLKKKYLKYREKYITLKNSSFIETTIRRICFDLPIKVNLKQASLIGPEKFKKYEYILYIAAQLSRLVYCDTGIMWYVIEKSLGHSNDIVNKVIEFYDTKFIDKKIIPIESQKGNSNLPMESYSLVVAKNNDPNYATYISSSNDMTCMILDSNKIKSNPNSILSPNDLFIIFKGSSSIENFFNFIESQFKSDDLGKLVDKIGVRIQGDNNIVPSSFVNNIVECWSPIIKSLEKHIKGEDSRLFLTGHSLGAGYCTLFGLILAEGKVTNTIPIMKNIKSIHIISFGSPKLFANNSCNLFNKHLDSGFITLDRMVNQIIKSESSILLETQFAFGLATFGLGLLGPNDLTPSFPFGFSHAGYKSDEKLYSIDNIRKTYGINTTSNKYRQINTWPFEENINFDDLEYRDELNKTINKLLNIDSNQLSGGVLSDYYMPNYISRNGSMYAYIYAHAEYLGMYYFTVLRVPFLHKNPAYKDKIAYFNLCDSGVKINYI